jgi:hypothetical protein
MALSNAEKERRRNDPRIKDITERICRYDSGKPYVFISYKSDDWERVLGDIVHKLVMDFGLNVYFDGDFNGHNPIWTQQFQENMDADNCKGVIAFVDNASTTSYATLMELLYSQVGCQQNEPPYARMPKPVVPINLEPLKIIHDKSDTGLGVQYYEDGTTNIHSEAEKDLFDRLFKKAEKYEIISNTVKPYKKAKEKLNKELCSAMFQEVLASIHANDNDIDAGITLEDIVHTIESECGKDVFGKIDSGLDDKSENEKKSIKDGENDRKTSDKGDESGKVSDGGGNIPPEKKALDTIKIISDGLIFHKRGKDGSYDAFYRKDGDKYVVLAGSKLRYNEKWTPKKIWEQYKEEITNEGILLCDINNLPISTAAKLIEGTSTSGKELDTNDSLMAVGETYEVSFDSSKTATDTGIIINPEKDDPEDVSEFILNGEPLGPGPMHPVEKTLWEYNTKGTRSKLMWNGETTGVSAVITVLKGSAVAAPSPNFEKSCKPAYTLKADLEAKGIIQNGKFTQDYTYDKVSTMINLLNGGSVSTPAEVKSGHLRKLDEKNKDVVKGKEDIADDIEDVLDDDMNDGDVGMATTSGFEYTLWGISHTSNKMSDMMNDVFDLIAERYPDRIEDIAEDDTITSVARKEDIDEGKIQGSKTANHFATFPFNKREHSLNGQIYYVNAGYNREGGIRQLCKMLIICDGNADGLKITKMPEKSSHSGGNTGKKGLGELL